MKNILKLFLIAGVFALLSISSASAEVFVVQNDEARFSMSFPDTWHRAHNQKPDDKLTVKAPYEFEFVSCKMRVRNDHRYLIYPVRYSADMQKAAYSKDFWFDYVNEYTNPYIRHVTDFAGLGRGFASYAEGGYTTAVGPKVDKRMIMFASLYRDKAYILECSSEASVYEKWRPHFLSVAKSVDFTKTIHDLPVGNYRNFIDDPAIKINGRRQMDLFVY